MGGSGGRSGGISFPTYIEETHQEWLGYSGSPTTITSDITAIMNAALAADGDPYLNQVLLNPSIFYDSGRNDWILVKALVDALSATTDWGAYVDAANSKAGTTLQDLVRADIITDSETDADTIFSGMLAQLQDPNFDRNTVQEYVSNALAWANAQLTDLNPSTNSTFGRTEADSSIDAAIAKKSTGITETTTWASFANQVKASLTTAEIDTPIAPASLVAQALTAATQSIEEAASLADQFLNDTVINSVVAGFEQRQQIPRARAKARLLAGMSQSGAHQGSALLLGLSILEAEQQGRANDLDAQLTLAGYQNAIQSFVQQHATFATGVFTASEQANLTTRNRLLTEGLGNLVQINVAKQQYERNLISLYSELTRFYASLDNQSDTVDKSSVEDMTRGMMATSTQLETARADYQRAFAQLWTEQFIQTLNAGLRVATINKASTEDFINRGSALMSDYNLKAVNQRQSLTGLRTEQDRIAIVANGEYEDRRIDVDVSSARWDFDVLTMGAHILAAPGGMAGTIPPKASRASSALGGALGGAGTGAAIGSVVPGVGTAVGAGVGALVGGIAGLLN